MRTALSQRSVQVAKFSGVTNGQQATASSQFQPMDAAAVADVVRLAEEALSAPETWLDVTDMSLAQRRKHYRRLMRA